MEQQVDAVLYLGPRSSVTAARMAPAVCADADYIEMRAPHGFGGIAIVRR